ncbi:cupin domain-containing protein [Streptomyces cucumeris]|uniref:cupin domain-containing protein n=1 Tax=Streptomyces cucumeris TaxID=2962890 RepID=UPI003D73BAB0
MAMTRRPATAEWLGLRPHPEGGWYRETWRAAVSAPLPGYAGDRATATAVYFLLTPGEEQHWHRVLSAELWLWHRGGPLRLLLGGPGERPETDEPAEVALGPDIAAGQRPQAVVPPGVWQSARPAADEEVLVSRVVSPGFELADFRRWEG